MNLPFLINEFYPLSLPEIFISQLSLDSRFIKPGDLFFAVPGTHSDGVQFINEALQKGANAILTEGNTFNLDWKDHTPIISIPKLKSLIGRIAAKFYHYPAKKMQMVGVTGTSGKTSCTQFIGNILYHMHTQCGVIGTLGNGLYGQLESTDLTTPDPITIQKLLANFVKQDAKLTAMEVSSHSLDQGRVNGIDFDVGIFTNLTRDHLDYHQTMENYAAAKRKLFDQSTYAVINADDSYGQEMLNSFISRKNVLAFSVQNKLKTPIYAENIQFSRQGMCAEIVTPWGRAGLQSSLVGQFNLNNLLSVIATLCLLDYPLSSVIESIAALQPVPGRMQSLGGEGKNPFIIIDYAHKPDALEKVLITLKKQCVGKLYCIFGCGGDRDRGKRPMMAAIAEKYADHIILTDDNPRYEDPIQIMNDILSGFQNTSKVRVEHDRAKAINTGIQLAGVNDYVLIAGKGAETYQIIGDIKLPFSDLDQVKKVIH